MFVNILPMLLLKTYHIHIIIIIRARMFIVYTLEMCIKNRRICTMSYTNTKICNYFLVFIKLMYFSTVVSINLKICFILIFMMDDKDILPF